MTSTELVEGTKVYFAAGEGPALFTEQDALDLLGETYGQDIDMIVVPVQRFRLRFSILASDRQGTSFRRCRTIACDWRSWATSLVMLAAARL
jgi:hypothetical protein